MPARCYLIWSNEHGAWWRPGERGYTFIIGEAGRYHLDRAARICDGANRFLEDGRQPNEVFVLAPECLNAEGKVVA